MLGEQPFRLLPACDRRASRGGAGSSTRGPDAPRRRRRCASGTVGSGRSIRHGAAPTPRAGHRGVPPTRARRWRHGDRRADATGPRDERAMAATSIRASRQRVAHPQGRGRPSRCHVRGRLRALRRRRPTTRLTVVAVEPGRRSDRSTCIAMSCDRRAGRARRS